MSDLGVAIIAGIVVVVLTAISAPSRRASLARLVAWSAWFYTLPLAREARDRRREEIRSHVFEHFHDPDIAGQSATERALLLSQFGR